MSGFGVLMVATLLIIVLPGVVMMVYYRFAQGEWLWQDNSSQRGNPEHSCIYCKYNWPEHR